MHLVGFIISIYHNARSSECQNAQLFHKLSHSYMFRRYHAILRQLVISNFASYTSISYVAVGILYYHHKIFKCSCWYIALPTASFEILV